MGRTEEQERLDVEVATALFGFRWVQWNTRALSGSPIYTPGRFLAPPDDNMAHLYEDAPARAPLHDHATAKVPEYSGDVSCAFAAAERAGLFSDGRAVLLQEGGADWVVEVRGLRLTSSRLPEVLCRASMEWAGVAPGPRR